MAEDAVDALAPYVHALPRVRTKSLPLFGVGEWRPSTDLELHLYRRFGDDARRVLELIEHDPSLASHPLAGQPYVAAEFLYSAASEMVTSLSDLLTRRTRAHIQDARSTVAGAEEVARLVAPTMSWNDEDVAREVSAYRRQAEREFSEAGLSLS